MRPISIKTLAGVVLATAVGLSIVGCSKGSDGAAGANGVNGTNGINGTNGTNGTNGANGTQKAFLVDAAAMTADQWMALNPQGSITSVSNVNGQPVVNFKIMDSVGNPVINLDTFTQKSASATVANFPNFAFYIAKLVGATASSPSKWVNYMVVAPGTTTLQAPNAESTGTMVGHGDGTYTYTFATDISKGAAAVAAVTDGSAAALGNVTVDLSAPTRMVIEFYGNARGYGIGRHANTPDGTSGPANAEMTTPINMIYDFVPATGKAPTASAPQREIVLTATCDQCHTKFNYHGAHRVQVQACVTCHTDQRRYGSTGDAVAVGNVYSGDTHQLNGTAELDFPQLVHKIHMGDSLQMTGYDFAVDSTIASQPNGTPPDQIRYPQSVANCGTCHATNAAAPQAGNWQMNPSRVACGACHDSVNFTTGTNHGPTNFAQTTDGACAGCHNPDGTGSFIATYHVPVTPPDPTNAGLPATLGGLSSNSHTNPAYVAGNQADLPAGANTVSWNIISTTQVPVATGGTTITWTFQILVNGSPATINTFNLADPTKWEILPGYVGGPTLYFAYAAPQDGIVPADYNGTISVNLHKLWRGGVVQAGNGVSQDPATKNIIATYNQATVPTGATMMTGGIGYFYGVVTTAQVAAATTPALQSVLTDSLPLTEVDLAAYPFGATVLSTNPLPYQGGLQVAVPNAWALLSGQTARRAIVTTAKCQSCHQNLGVFTDAVFHSGQRNNAETCTFCHNANSMDAGWGYNIKEVVHSLHASSKRTVPFTWQAGHTYWDTTYPAVLNNCEACHVAGSYDFTNAASMAAVNGNKLLWTTTATGTPAAGSIVLTDPTAYLGTAAYIAPNYVPGTAYGNAPSFNTGVTAKSNVKWPSTSATPTTITTVALGASVEADPTTLVNSPITSACYACHDDVAAAAHMRGQGGFIGTQRANVVTATATVAGTTVTSPLVQSEACLTCHGSGALADIKAVHMNF